MLRFPTFEKGKDELFYIPFFKYTFFRRSSSSKRFAEGMERVGWFFAFGG